MDNIEKDLKRLSLSLYDNMEKWELRQGNERDELNRRSPMTFYDTETYFEPAITVDGQYREGFEKTGFVTAWEYVWHYEEVGAQARERT